VKFYLVTSVVSTGQVMLTPSATHSIGNNFKIENYWCLLDMCENEDFS
jgi:hypothetical protein